MAKFKLPSVTLCAAASVNVSPTLAALRASMDRLSFAESLLFTDQPVSGCHGIRVIQVPRLNSAMGYSEFCLKDLAEHIRTSHCLIVQWDGFVLNADRWDPAFLEYDYIGAVWPQFEDGCNVGNGGFSLRSRRLLEACRDPRFRMGGPEDVAICRVNRSFLEAEHGIRFADRSVADRFSFERTVPTGPTLGFHGIFNMIEAVGADRFWEIYRSLDDSKTAFVDFPLIFRQLGRGDHATSRRAKLTADRLAGLFRG